MYLKSVFSWILIQFFLSAILFGTAFSSEVSNEFIPGFGQPVGEITLLDGNVVITHSKGPKKFLAKKGLPLYNGDTLSTGKKGRVRFKLNDGSIITLSSSTTLVINNSIYKPKQKRRSSFLKMIIGKARFFVTKMLKFREKAFKVKTSTFVAGVRGSDFIIEAKKNSANLTALKGTAVEVTSFAAPEKTVIVKDFQRTIVPKGQPPGRVIDVPMDEIRKLEKIFNLPKDTDKRGTTADKDDKKKKDSGKQDTRIPGDSLVQPGTTVEPDYYYIPEEPIYPEREETLYDNESRDQAEQVEVETSEEALDDELPEGVDLPWMPGTPE